MVATNLNSVVMVMMIFVMMVILMMVRVIISMLKVVMVLMLSSKEGIPIETGLTNYNIFLFLAKNRWGRPTFQMRSCGVTVSSTPASRTTRRCFYIPTSYLSFDIHSYLMCDWIIFWYSLIFDVWLNYYLIKTHILCVINRLPSTSSPSTTSTGSWQTTSHQGGRILFWIQFVLILTLEKKSVFIRLF